jgi:phytanoyl-CoA hydroxylase
VALAGSGAPCSHGTQDAGALWGLDRDPELQLWTALDDAGLDAAALRSYRARTSPDAPRRSAARFPTRSPRPPRAHERKVCVPAKAGDVVLIHNLVWHGSAANRTDRPRRAMSACYMPSTTRCVRKKRAPRTFPRVHFGGARPAR